MVQEEQEVVDTVRTGYHYTTASHWKQIKRKGLVPYKLYKKEIQEALNVHYVNGIWIWQKKLFGLSHIGTILFQMAGKGELSAVCLKVKYDPFDILKEEKRKLNLSVTHSGTLGNIKYHDGEPAVIVLKPIPIKHIEIIGDYHLGEAFK